MAEGAGKSRGQETSCNQLMKMHFNIRAFVVSRYAVSIFKDMSRIYSDAHGRCLTSLPGNIGSRSWWVYCPTGKRLCKYDGAQLENHRIVGCVKRNPRKVGKLGKLYKIPSPTRLVTLSKSGNCRHFSGQCKICRGRCTEYYYMFAGVLYFIYKSLYAFEENTLGTVCLL